MTQNHGSPRAHIVNVGIAIGVEDPGAFGSLDKQRIHTNRAAGTNRAVHATRNDLSSLGKKPFRNVFFHET